MHDNNEKRRPVFTHPNVAPLLTVDMSHGNKDQRSSTQVLEGTSAHMCTTTARKFKIKKKNTDIFHSLLELVLGTKDNSHITSSMPQVVYADRKNT